MFYWNRYIHVIKWYWIAGTCQLLAAIMVLHLPTHGADNAKEGERVVRMVNEPALSPDGQQIAFCWADELWTVGIEGGAARRLTHHPAVDAEPHYSPDGSKIAFVSRRTGSPQIFVIPASGGVPEQKTFHSEGYSLADWFPDGNSLLAIGQRDHYWRSAERLLRVYLTDRRNEEVLVDATALDAKLSPDGERLLFVREGERWWRKGYRGQRAAQIWHLDLKPAGENSGKSGDAMRQLLHEGIECRWPLWQPNGKGFYFTKGDMHGFDLWRYRFRQGEEGRQRYVTGFDEDSIVEPTISRDGSTIVFRHLFDLYKFHPGATAAPIKIDIRLASDTELPQDLWRRSLNKCEEIAYSDDGLELAMIAGGDLWMMDTELKEPVRVTKSSGAESDPVFAPDGKSLWFVRGEQGEVDLWKVERKDPDRAWWQQVDFVESRVTKTEVRESEPKFTPDGNTLLFQRGRGELWRLDPATLETARVVPGSGISEFVVSSDSRWIAYAKLDEDFNSEIWLAPLDGSRLPTNVSRHPDNDAHPAFSPDGRLLAFTGRRHSEEVDLYYVYLQATQDEKTMRDRRMEKAIEAMKKRASTGSTSKSPTKSPRTDNQKEGGESTDDEEKPEKKPDEKPSPMIVDLEEIHERVHRISIPDSAERNLLFSPDSQRLAFAAKVDGKEGWYTVEFPDKLKPKLLSSTLLSSPVWTRKANGILGLNEGIPAKLAGGEKLETYPFTAQQERSRAERLREGFNAAWRLMRDTWYDPRLGNRNWDAVRRKYESQAAESHHERGLGQVISLMLGELNGSHLGFTPKESEDSSPRETSAWKEETAHLGVRFVADDRGPGLLIRDVLPHGPADRESSRLHPGDRLLSIDGQQVDRNFDLTLVLNGNLQRDIRLVVQRKVSKKEEAGASPADAIEQKEVTVSLRPISYARARELLYDHWLDHNRALVQRLSEGRLGYLHIRAMDMASFHEFERQLYLVGYGREGLIIDVRDNGGGSTTDHLLTALTQPRHAVTIGRDGGLGYPQDRMVYASWHKPIVVLCNQNSFSNAEIFSHAIKTLGRGKLVGVQTAGGVISTGSAAVTDVGTIRIPHRGWFLLRDGKDMELNGAEPDFVVWPKPDELPQGIDRQLEKAVMTLQEEVVKAASFPTPKYATE